MANILNNSDGGFHIGIMCLIYRVLRRSSVPMKIEKIEEMCGPKNLAQGVSAQAKFKQHLNFWKDESHCLWRLNRDSMLELCEETKTVRDDPTPFEIAEMVRRSLFSKLISDITVPIRSTKNEEKILLLILSCLLASGRHLPFGSDGPLKKAPYLEIDDLIGSYLERDNYGLNTNEKPFVIPWLLFLGFAEVHGGKVFVDPTRAVRDSLPYIFKSEKSLDITTFLGYLSDVLPVLGGGTYQNQTSKMMEKNGWTFDYKRHISPALAVVFYRLKALKVIEFDEKSDDPLAKQIEHPFTKKPKFITQVIYLGGD